MFRGSRISTHLKLSLATATHNFKWVKIYMLSIIYCKNENVKFSVILISCLNARVIIDKVMHEHKQNSITCSITCYVPFYQKLELSGKTPLKFFTKSVICIRAPSYISRNLGEAYFQFGP